MLIKTINFIRRSAKIWHNNKVCDLSVNSKWGHKYPIFLENLFLKIASFIDDKYEYVCWADLVLWAMGFHKFLDILRFKEDFTVRENCDWCGKCIEVSRGRG